MAGVRHHILPRFLLKGFASKTVGEEVFTWVHRKGGNIFETNIKNVAVERYFYGKAGDLNVDDEITDIERGFAILLDELRHREDGYEVTDPRLADFVTHLSSRTKHLRDSLIDTSEVLLITLTSHISDPRNFERWAADYYRRHPEVVKKAFKDALQKMQTTRPQRLILRRQLAKMGVESLISHMDLSQEAQIFQAAAAQVIEKLPSIVRNGHIKALAKSLIPEARVEQYRSLRWRVFKSPGPFILGDIGCLFEVEGKFVSSTGKDDELKNVFLPIARNALLVGTPLISHPKVSVEAVNEAIAKSSREFFICSESSSRAEVLLDILGEDSEILSADEIHQLVREVILEG